MKEWNVVYDGSNSIRVYGQHKRDAMMSAFHLLKATGVRFSFDIHDVQLISNLAENEFICYLCGGVFQKIRNEKWNEEEQKEEELEIWGEIPKQDLAITCDSCHRKLMERYNALSDIEKTMFDFELLSYHQTIKLGQ